MIYYLMTLLEREIYNSLSKFSKFVYNNLSENLLNIDDTY